MHGPKRARVGAVSPVGLERWDDLRVFLTVLRQGSFSAAARQLGIEQSTVSRRIAALEESVGTALFERLPEGPAPTELAARLRERAELIESEILDFGDLAREASTSSGKVTLALTESFAVHVVIPHVVAALHKQHPQLSLHLLTSDRSVDLTRREADLALRFYRPTSGDLVSKRLARLPLAVLAHKRYARTCGRDPEQLSWISVHLPGIAQPQNQWLSSHLGVTPVLTVSSHLAQIEAVRAGLGVALLSRSICKLDKNLLELDVGMPSGPHVELWLVAPRTLRKVPRVSAVWQALETSLTILDER